MSTSEAAARVFQQHRDELGFVNEAQCAEKDLLVEERDGEIVGAALANHCVRKPQTTLYELAVLPAYRREGIASLLVDRLASDSPHETLVAKCPEDLPANDFYAATGWERVGRDEGKHRALNVWERPTGPGIDIYMTVNGGTKTAATIESSCAKPGVESGNTWPLDTAPAFVDYPFTDPDATFEDHLRVVERYQPEITVAPDVELGRSVEEVAAMADRLAEHADHVIIVPKDCHPTDVPERHRVGLTVGKFGSMAPWSVWEYRDAGPVHILGGTPNQQLALRGMVEIASMDSFTLGQRAAFGMWDDGAVDAPDDMDYYDRLRASLNNYWRTWNHE